MIVHVDMDAFYASVEVRDNPTLKGKPVAVGGSPQGRGVICAANYEARKFGIHSAMPSAHAIRLCKNLVFLPVNMQKYIDVSSKIRDIFYRYTPEVEPLSLDEAFLDVDGSKKLFGSAIEIGHAIKNDIQNELNLTASVGIAQNKYVAKVASDINKPNGFLYIEPGKESQFLDPLPINRLWGIGKASEKRFHEFSLNSIKDIRQSNVQDLETEFGKQGRKVWYLANGIDTRSVESERKAKSISHETTFSQDISDIHALTAILINLTESVASRLRHKQIKCRTVILKLRLADFSRVTRSRTLLEATDITSEIWNTAKSLLQQFYQSENHSLRLIGVGAGGLKKTSEQNQKDLFAEETSSMTNIDKVTDKINAKYGDKIIHRARTTPKNN